MSDSCLHSLTLLGSCSTVSSWPTTTGMLNHAGECLAMHAPARLPSRYHGATTLPPSLRNAFRSGTLPEEYGTLERKEFINTSNGHGDGCQPRRTLKLALGHILMEVYLPRPHRRLSTYYEPFWSQIPFRRRSHGHLKLSRCFCSEEKR